MPEDIDRRTAPPFVPAIGASGFEHHVVSAVVVISHSLGSVRYPRTGHPPKHVVL
jgi:hypothetical protein